MVAVASYITGNYMQSNIGFPSQLATFQVLRYVAAILESTEMDLFHHHRKFC